MSITSPTNQSILNVPLQNGGQVIGALKVGQVVDAKVIAQLANGNVRLALLNTMLDAHLPVPTQIGMSLRFEILANGSQPQLKLLTTNGQGQTNLSSENRIPHGSPSNQIQSGHGQLRPGQLDASQSRLQSTPSLQINSSQSNIRSTNSYQNQQTVRSSISPYIHFNQANIHRSNGVNGLIAQSSPLSTQRLHSSSLSNSVHIPATLGHLSLSASSSVHSSLYNLLPSLSASHAALKGSASQMAITSSHASHSLQSAAQQNPALQSLSIALVTPEQALRRAMTRSLERQDSLAPLFATLSQTQRPSSPPLPDFVRSFISDLLGMRFGGDKPMNAETIRMGLQRSGILREAQMMRNLMPQNDLKGGVARLIQMLTALTGASADATELRPERPSPPSHQTTPNGQKPANSVDVSTLTPRELASHVQAQADAALSRIRLSQIASLGDQNEQTLRGEPNGKSDWFFEMPFIHDGETAVMGFHIRREEQAKKQEKQTQQWHARFALDTHTSGAVHAHVTLAHQQSERNRVSITLWAERADVANRLEQFHEDLREILAVTDLDIGHLHIRTGRPPISIGYPGHFLNQPS